MSTELTRTTTHWLRQERKHNMNPHHLAGCIEGDSSGDAIRCIACCINRGTCNTHLFIYRWQAELHPATICKDCKAKLTGEEE